MDEQVGLITLSKGAVYSKIFPLSGVFVPHYNVHAPHHSVNLPSLEKRFPVAILSHKQHQIFTFTPTLKLHHPDLLLDFSPLFLMASAL